MAYTSEAFAACAWPPQTSIFVESLRIIIIVKPQGLLISFF
jgi:hypothetical protein